MSIYHSSAGPEVNGPTEFTYILTDDENATLVRQIPENVPTFMALADQMESIGSVSFHTSHGLSITMMNWMLYNTQVKKSNDFYTGETAVGGKMWPGYLAQMKGKRDGWKFVGAMRTPAMSFRDVEHDIANGRSIVIVNRGTHECPSLFNETSIGYSHTCYFVMKMVDFNTRVPDYQFKGIGRPPAVEAWDSSTPAGARWAPQWVAVNSSCNFIPPAARAFEIKYGHGPGVRTERHLGPVIAYGTCTHSPHWKQDVDFDPLKTWSEMPIENDNAGAFLHDSQLDMLLNVH